MVDVVLLRLRNPDDFPSLASMTIGAVYEAVSGLEAPEVQGRVIKIPFPLLSATENAAALAAALEAELIFVRDLH
jgi:hypothetical protein